MSRTSISDVDGPYLDWVRAAVSDEDAFARFRQLRGIKNAVECVTPADGAAYRAIVLKQSPELLEYLDKFKGSDSVGSPDTAPYPEGAMSPTTWRYVKVLSDLRMLFGDLDGLNIAEIGVGYGGQCKIITDLYNVASYTMYDLEPVNTLARKYLEAAGAAVAGKLDLADFRRLGQDDPRTYDLVISNWALSECTIVMADHYIEHVLRRSKRGYITSAFVMYLFEQWDLSYQKDEFIDAIGFPTELMAEGINVDVPVEGMENFILYWHSQPLLA